MQKKEKKEFLEIKQDVSKKLKKVLSQKISIPRTTSEFLSDTLQIV